MVFLGIYDVCKKHALRDNAVLPVLFFSNLASVAMALPLLVGSAILPVAMASLDLFVEPITAVGHRLMLLKAFSVSMSWIFAYFALKHLPISIVSPIRASGPVWTLVGAIVLFHESPSPLQWAGMALIFAGYFAFSIIGREEGIHFYRSKWILYIFLATLIGTCSTLFDKWLIHRQGYSSVQVQVWYTLYLGLLFTLYFFALWWPQRKRSTPFVWRWSIPFIGVLLYLADYVYFKALSDPASLIVILSILRRCSVVISFLAGAFLFKEVNKRKKAWVLLGILAGVVLIVLAG
ncbi:MAG: EamA family transporter [Pontiellaceae bacterium]|nr:EamA family transporter [Pontiellaceae bacterium]